jgi:hypothetical protein
VVRRRAATPTDPEPAGVLEALWTGRSESSQMIRHVLATSGGGNTVEYVHADLQCVV